VHTKDGLEAVGLRRDDAAEARAPNSRQHELRALGLLEAGHELAIVELDAPGVTLVVFTEDRIHRE
jgi:hypothetical protein